MSNDEVVRLLLQVTGAEDLDDLREKAAGAREKIDALAGGTDKAAKSTRNLGRATLESGRILQDFAQGGVGGILNNIEGLSLALGGGPGLAGIMTALGLAAYFAIPAVKATWAAIADGSNGVPEAAGKLDRMSESLKTINERLKDLKEKGWLTDSELSEYNGKLAKRVELEEKITGEKEKQAVFDKSRKESEEKGRNKETARIAQEIVSETGGPEEAVRRAGRSMLQSSERGGEIGRLMDRIESIEKQRRQAADADSETVLHRDAGGRADAVYIPESREVKFKGADGAVYQVDFNAFFDGLVRDVSKKIDDEAASIQTRAEQDVKGALQGDSEAASRMFAHDPANAARWNAATPGGLAYAERKKEAEEVEKLDARQRNKEADRQERLRQAEEKKDAEEQARAEKLFESQRNAKEARLSSHLQGADAANKAKAARDAAKAERDAETAARQAERDAEKAAKEALPGNRLQARREQAYQTAAGIATAENNGEFTAAQLQAIARQAADSTGSLDVASVRQAVYQSAAMTRARIQQELDRNMRRMFQGGGFNYGGD